MAGGRKPVDHSGRAEHRRARHHLIGQLALSDGPAGVRAGPYKAPRHDPRSRQFGHGQLPAG